MAAFETDMECACEIGAALLSLMSSEHRLLVLIALADDELSVASLAENTGTSALALSQHLSKLRAAKLVSTRRDGNKIYYSLTSPAVRKLLIALEEIFANSAFES